MRHLIKLVIVATLSVLILRPTAPFNKQAYANPAPKVVAASKPQQPKVEVPIIPEPIPVVEPVVTPVAAVPTYVAGTSDAQQFIYAHESGNNPAAINASSGACGLGQALPCSKLLNVCGSLANVDCQKQFFDNYAIARYGSWSNAYAFWQVHRWW